MYEREEIGSGDTARCPARSPVSHPPSKTVPFFPYRTGGTSSETASVVMEQNVIKFVKPIALFLITFVSVLYLTKSLGVALVISLVPLLLGWLAIMQSFAYAMAAVVFLSAVTWAVTPVSVKGILSQHADRAIAEVSREVGKD